MMSSGLSPATARSAERIAAKPRSRSCSRRWPSSPLRQRPAVSSPTVMSWSSSPKSPPAENPRPKPMWPPSATAKSSKNRTSGTLPCLNGSTAQSNRRQEPLSLSRLWRRRVMPYGHARHLPAPRVPSTDRLNLYPTPIADGTGIWTSRDGQWTLGHTRLSIIGLRNGSQPMTSPDGAVHVVVNGEFYGYRALREDLRAKGYWFATDSDSEIALHLYR